MAAISKDEATAEMAPPPIKRGEYRCAHALALLCVVIRREYGEALIQVLLPQARWIDWRRMQ